MAPEERPFTGHRSMLTGEKMPAVLFVCYGNICRSPSALGVFRTMLAASPVAGRVRLDSAATHDLHPGEAPDARSQAHALARGYDISDLRARQVGPADAQAFDLILVMEQNNLTDLKSLWPHTEWSRVRLMTDFCSSFRLDRVPDPYHGGPADFALVLDVLEDACAGLLKHLEQELLQEP